MPHVDVTLALLTNQRRRWVLRPLTEGPTDIRTLAEAITAVEEGMAVEDVDYDDRQGIHTALQQVHLPKLSDAGAVIWERESGWVAPGRYHPVFIAALRALEAVEGVEVDDDPLPTV